MFLGRILGVTGRVNHGSRTRSVSRAQSGRHSRDAAFALPLAAAVDAPPPRRFTISLGQTVSERRPGPGAGEPAVTWEPLSYAVMRRGLRGQLVQRAATGGGTSPMAGCGRRWAGSSCDGALVQRFRRWSPRPGNTDWQRDLSVSHGKIGDALQSFGDVPARCSRTRRRRPRTRTAAAPARRHRSGRGHGRHAGEV